jgi:ubiquinone/menaquinone biosynthesis C-methylase UbiE
VNQPLYNSIGTDYNTTRRADPYLSNRLLHWLAPEPNGLYLDIGCGTGNYTTWLAQNGLNIWGVDPSETMLAEARAKSNQLTWKIGTAETVPAGDQTFDGAIATLTIHHWPDRTAAFQELYRVLRPRAKLVIFTALPEQMQGYWLNHYFPQMLAVSTAQMPTLAGLLRDAAGFSVIETEPYFIQPDSQDLFLYAGKHRPGLYLDPAVRKNISSFANLAHADEVTDGLARLQADLETGAFARVKAAFDTMRGDYLFVVLNRN